MRHDAYFVYQHSNDAIEKPGGSLEPLIQKQKVPSKIDHVTDVVHGNISNIGVSHNSCSNISNKRNSSLYKDIASTFFLIDKSNSPLSKPSRHIGISLSALLSHALRSKLSKYVNQNFRNIITLSREKEIIAQSRRFNVTTPQTNQLSNQQRYCRDQCVLCVDRQYVQFYDRNKCISNSSVFEEICGCRRWRLWKNLSSD